ncbi:MAG: hypothetical protein Q8S42_08960 [Archangium sp.]|nr:hypothetical protein [Archangium sp.]
MTRRALALSMLVLAASAHASPETRHSSAPSNRVWHAVLIGATGLALAGGYAAGAVLTADQPAAQPLAITGGVLSGGMLGVTLALGLGAARDDPGSLVGYILWPVICGVVGALLGGLLTGLGAREPGTLRTVTHVVVVSLLIGETVVLEFARLAR